MNLQTLEYFVTVVKEKSITRAAEKLYISQPALTKQIKRLEELLGFPVFNRYSQGVTLTIKGERFFNDIEPTIHQLRFDIAKHITDQNIKIGSDPFLAMYYYPDYFDNTEQLNIQITKVTDDTIDLIPLMKSGEIDAAIIQDYPHQNGLISTWLFDDEFYAAVPEKYESAKNQSISITECLKYTQLLPFIDSPLYSRIKVLIENHVEKPPEIIEMPYHSLIGFVAQGAGISYLPSMVVQKINYKGVKFIPIEESPIKRKMYLYALNKNTFHLLKKVFEKQYNDSFLV
ncbi:LysR family transcriptional regulator [Oceanobacillus jeddahense]|uniref:LysR family transcriptional regulator n=1 Tax=Oceanobacillus jeddahense TaxID=1462527 RepID=UPI0005961AB3|nr:LysR family transcriptional regulator [Oceanobacillus jeddahense]